MRIAFVLAFGAVSFFLSVSPLAAAEAPPLAGCYERVYDAAHLAAHKGQFVRRVVLKIGPSAFGKPEPGDKQPIIADAAMQIWVKGRDNSFETVGACWADGETLVCNASLSAAEVDICKAKKDGVRDCRINPAESGSFQIAKQPEGLMTRLRERLEMSESGSDAGPWLYLSPGNAENHGFLLKPAAGGVCK